MGMPSTEAVTVMVQFPGTRSKTAVVWPAARVLVTAAPEPDAVTV